MPLPAAVWPPFATQVFGGGVSTFVWWGRGVSAMEALDRTLVNVYNLLIVTIPLIQFDRDVPAKFARIFLDV